MVGSCFRMTVWRHGRVTLPRDRVAIPQKQTRSTLPVDLSEPRVDLIENNLFIFSVCFGYSSFPPANPGGSCKKGVRLTLPRPGVQIGVLVVGLLGYRHTVTQERDPTIVAHRYDLFKMSKLQGPESFPAGLSQIE